MFKTFFISLTFLLSPAYAEVYKCRLESEKTVYQSTPCVSAIKQQTIEIQKSDPRKVAEAEAKLKAWKEDYAAREQARIKAEKEQQAERDRKASVAALQKSADYEEQQAYEAKRLADALEQRNMLRPESYFYYPYYPTMVPLQHQIPSENLTTPRKSDDNTVGARFFIHLK